jgi:hypothetical protein
VAYFQLLTRIGTHISAKYDSKARTLCHANTVHPHPKSRQRTKRLLYFNIPISGQGAVWRQNSTCHSFIVLDNFQFLGQRKQQNIQSTLTASVNMFSIKQYAEFGTSSYAAH